MRTFRLHATRWLLSAIAIASIAIGCGDSTKPDGDSEVGQIVIGRADAFPFEQAVVVAESLPLVGTVIDTAGNELPDAAIQWSAKGGHATVTSSGTVVGVSPGISYIFASADGRRDSLGITVLPQADSMALLPTALGIVLGGHSQVIPYLYAGTDHLDSYGRVITWTRSNNAIAVEGRFIGTVEGVSAGSTQLTATGSGVTRSMTVDVNAISFTGIDGGFRSTCGVVTTTGRIYCWGVNIYRQLGHPFVEGSAEPLRVEGVPAATQIAVGQVSACALAANGDAWCWGADQGNLGRGSLPDDAPDRLPGLVTGGLHFTSIAAGSVTTCGLANGGSAYCWGYNAEGMVGNGDTARTTVPTAVSGARQYTQISMSGSEGAAHVCAIATDAKAYCWGNNAYGQLGIGSVGGSHLVPTAVGGGLTFTSISVGSTFTCGVATGGAAYCWGSNDNGELGSAGGADSLPRSVTSNAQWTVISAGWRHACGMSGGVALCWGSNTRGELGNNTNSAANSPVAVTGGLSFGSITAATGYTCGVTTNNVGYCWGGVEGEPGTGVVGSKVPMKVLGQP